MIRSRVQMQPMIFLNVSWMGTYQGLSHDTISGGFGYVARHGYGSEIFNFKSYKGNNYGFVRAPHNSIRLEKLGAAKGAPAVRGVLVVWVARSRIVGWYKNATVFRSAQLPPSGAGRVFKGHRIKFNVVAKRGDCTLLDPDARLFAIPRSRKRAHAMGRYLWYAEGRSNRVFRDRVREYITAGGIATDMKQTKAVKKGGWHQADPFKREQVERSAIATTTAHFAKIGYDIESVEADNVGWDLDAVHQRTGIRLRLEVKGLSGGEVVADITPQEYQMMGKYKESYRVCIVTRCLEKAHKSLHVFAYERSNGLWTDSNDRLLEIEERMSARLRA
jgi:hypothetical protein